MKRALICGLVAVGGVLASLTVAAGAVSAHATLVSADPANGSMLTTAPDHVELVFDENVGKPAAIAVLDQNGNEVEGGELQVVDKTLSRTYDPTSFAPGVYTISYQAVSADGHPISGELTFMTRVSGATVMGDAAQLARVVRNVLANAVRHATSRVEVALAEHDAVELSIDDDGPGIPVEDRERVFERFVRLDESRAQASGGSGLGLAIAHDIVTAHEGSIEIDDAPIGGARVRVTLPAADPARPPREQAPLEAEQSQTTV